MFPFRYARYAGLLVALVSLHPAMAVNPQALYERAQHSAAVVVGTVGKSRELTDLIGSVHDAVWAEAPVTVDTWILGETEKVVLVRFDESQDRAHVLEPKLIKGERVLLLLQQDENAEYFISDPIDRQDVSTEAALRELLAHPPTSSKPRY